MNEARLCLGTVATIPQILYEYGEPWWNYIDRGKPVPMSLPQQISHGLTQALTWTSMVKGQRLTA
jgi:hypothetical protein